MLLSGGGTQSLNSTSTSQASQSNSNPLQWQRNQLWQGAYPRQTFPDPSMSSVGQNVSQMVNVIMSQDSGEGRQPAGVLQSQMSTLDSVLANGSSILSEVESVLASPGPGAMSTPTHDLQAQPVIFKREVMDTDAF